MAERKSVLLRVDEELWKELNTWAAHELRSANGQAEWILREAVNQRKKGKRREEDKHGKSKNKAA